MPQGTMVQFDDVKGYGFIAPDDGGTDVFVHANSLSGAHTPVACGTRLEFSIVSGDRGPKAYDVRLIGAPPLRMRSGSLAPAPEDGAGPADTEPVETTAAEPGTADGRGGASFSAAAYTARCTEALLADVPDLTGRQIVQIRASMLRLAAELDWIG